jgi:hypothetical protein
MARLTITPQLVDLILESAGGRQSMLDFATEVGPVFPSCSEPRGNVSCVEPDAYLSDCLVRNGFSRFGDLNEVPGHSLEFVFALNVLEHIADDGAALRLVATTAIMRSLEWKIKSLRAGEGIILK